MNQSLARYYGYGPPVKASGHDPAFAELEAIRRLVEAREHGKVSSGHHGAEEARLVALLGGEDAAQQKCSSSLHLVRAWQRGEADGASLAREGIFATFEHAQR